MKLPGQGRRRGGKDAAADATPTASSAGATEPTEPDEGTEPTGTTALDEGPLDEGTGQDEAADAAEPAKAEAAADQAAGRDAPAGRRRAGGSAGGVLRNRVRRFLQRPGTADLSRYTKLLPQIAAEEDRLRELTGEELADAAGDAVEDAELCAVGREAARRALSERPFDVQLVGSMAMLSGQIAEMATGAGSLVLVSDLVRSSAARYAEQHTSPFDGPVAAVAAWTQGNARAPGGGAVVASIGDY